MNDCPPCRTLLSYKGLGRSNPPQSSEPRPEPSTERDPESDPPIQGESIKCRDIVQQTKREKYRHGPRWLLVTCVKMMIDWDAPINRVKERGGGGRRAKSRKDTRRRNWKERPKN